ncbi:MAG: DUF1922 domain-containing protein [Candidatus Bathyarchaeia archaeon]
MPLTFIVRCNKCSGLLLANAEQKTKTCPYCGGHLNINRCKRLAYSENVFEASEILRKLKLAQKSNPKKPAP